MNMTIRYFCTFKAIKKLVLIDSKIRGFVGILLNEINDEFKILCIHAHIDDLQTYKFDLTKI